MVRAQTDVSEIYPAKQRSRDAAGVCDEHHASQRFPWGRRAVLSDPDGHRVELSEQKGEQAINVTR